MSIGLISGAVAMLFWVVCNIITAKKFSAEEMRKIFICGQCLVGKICANIFYSLAWLLKLIRVAVITLVK